MKNLKISLLTVALASIGFVSAIKSAGPEELRQAIDANNISEIQSHIRKGRVGASDYVDYQRTPTLVYVATNDQIKPETLQALLNDGVKSNKDAALVAVARTSGHITRKEAGPAATTRFAKIRALLRAGANPDFKDSSGQSTYDYFTALNLEDLNAKLNNL